MAEGKEELKNLLMKVKEEKEKVGVKFNIQKSKTMASGPIISWQIDGETVIDFIFLCSKITADGDCNHEIKRHLLLGRKAITKQHIKKQRHSFANKVLSSQSYVFFQQSCMDVRVGLQRKPSAEELMLLKCGVGEDS